LILGGLGAAPPADRSMVEAFLGEKPGFLAAALGQIKTLLILSTVVTLAMGAVVLVTQGRALRRNPAGPRRRFPRLTRRAKQRASRYIGQEVRAYKRGRWRSRAQAVAVGLSRARRGR
jgi:hypothetical protein